MQLKSSILTGSEAFKANTADHEAALAQISEAAAQAALGGGERSRERHLSRGKMLPRRRIANLLDPGSPFLKSAQPQRMTCTATQHPVQGL